jgi:hypothetical protein
VCGLVRLSLGSLSYLATATPDWKPSGRVGAAGVMLCLAGHSKPPCRFSPVRAAGIIAMPCPPLSGTGVHMSAANRVVYLRIALIVIGLSFIFGFYPLSIIWPSGWAWGQGHSHYLMMIMGIYATLGVFLLMASRDPDAHKSIIWFTVWSSVVHGAIMAWQGFSDVAERGHLLGDVPALFLIAMVLGVLMQMGSSDRVMTATATGRPIVLGQEDTAKSMREGRHINVRPNWKEQPPRRA